MKKPSDPLLSQTGFPEENDGKTILLLTRDPEMSVILVSQLSHFGYRVQLEKEVDTLTQLTIQSDTFAVMVDVDLPDGGLDYALIEVVKAAADDHLPLIFLSQQTDQATRLHAIRAGGEAFFAKPVQIVNLIDHLDSLDAGMDKVPYRVLIVDDQPTVAAYYKMVLEMGGLVTEVVSDSSKVLEILESFHPDLIMLDLYMPEISGFEIARLIRQMEEYVSIPIVYLSSEDDFTKKMDAMSLGADDFLTKPVKAEQLIGLVKNRVDRLQTLRHFIIRDSLTGLLNHTGLRMQLKQELNRCERQGSSLAVAMLDLDHFKQINDTHGHATGDAVLKSLSRLLMQRLRKSDIIGRYGGEEFVIILLDVNEMTAFRVLDEIRELFSEILHLSPRMTQFQVTLSCGIATYPGYESASHLLDAADRALYQAKNSGRNSVVLDRSSEGQADG